MSGERRQGFPISLCQLVPGEGGERERARESRVFPNFPPSLPPCLSVSGKGGKREKGKRLLVFLCLSVSGEKSQEIERGMCPLANE